MPLLNGSLAFQNATLPFTNIRFSFNSTLPTYQEWVDKFMMDIRAMIFLLLLCFFGPLLVIPLFMNFWFMAMRSCPRFFVKWLFEDYRKLDSLQRFLINAYKPKKKFLALIPKGPLQPCTIDNRPEFDRSEFFAKGNKYQDYRVVVVIKIFGIWLVTDRWYEPQLYASAGRNWYRTDPNLPGGHHWNKLQKVRLNMGLLATLLNRKTLAADKTKPELEIDRALRLMKANPHYQEDFGYMKRGRSVYADMSLICGAIITQDPYHNNQYF